MPNTIQVRRGTTAEWAAANPVLASGEIGRDTTLKREKVGDGVTAWASLEFTTWTDAAVAAKFVDTALTGATTIARLGIGETAPTSVIPEWGQHRILPAALVGASNNVVAVQRSMIFDGDFTVRATVTVTATGGTATWTVAGQSAVLAYNATASDVQTALAALSTVGAAYLDVTGGPGGAGGGTPYVVSYRPRFILHYGFRELTVTNTGLTGTGAGVTQSWVNKMNIDTGWFFGANDYVVTGATGGGMARLVGRLSEVAIRNSGAYGEITGASAEASWAGAAGTGAVEKMVGFKVLAGRHKGESEGGLLGDNTAVEVVGLHVEGLPDGRVLTGVSVTSGNTTITAPGARFKTLADRGRIVSGTGIPASTYIASVAEDGDTAVLSQAPTSTGTITLTIAPTAQATTAHLARFGYGTVLFEGRVNFKPGWKSEPAARFYPYPGATSGDPVFEWYDIAGTTRQGYVTNQGVLAAKNRIVSSEAATDSQVAIGSNTTEVGTGASVSLGTDNNVYLYRRAGYKALALKADNGLRLGRAATASRPTVASLGGSASERSAHLFYDTDLDKPIWSSGTAWKEAANTLYATATLDFASIAAGGSQELTITVTGAVAGDTVHLGAPAAIEAGLVWNGYVSAADTVKVRLSNITASSIDPASASWKATIVR